MATLNQCRSELRSIIREIRDIEDGIRSDFQGIGQDVCANKLESVAVWYNDGVMGQLNSVNPNLLADWALKEK